MAIIWDSDGYFNKIIPAYDSIPYLVEDDGTSGLGGVPPQLYADIYFDTVYYKTLTMTSPSSITGVISFWAFDISGICQEYLNTRIPDITSNSYQETYGSSKHFGAAMAYVKFRNSTVDAFGVITPGGTPPVQGTVDSAPIPGDGFVSDTFMVVNGALQVTDLLDLENMLKKFRVTGTFLQSPGSPAYPQNVDANYRVYGLSYLQNGKCYMNDYGQLPIISCRQAYLGSSFTTASICLMIVNRAGSLIYMNNLAAMSVADYSIYYIPVGIKNLVQMFPSAASQFPLGYYYRVGLFDPAAPANKFIYASPKYFIQKYDGQTPPIQPLAPGANTPKHTRLWFQNYLGHFDQINFIEREETLKVSSVPTEFPLNPLLGFNTVGAPGEWQSGRSLHSMSRNGVRSNENNVVSGQFQESDIPFIKQLMDSSKVYIEFISPDNVDTNPPAAMLLPITIVDGEFPTFLFENRYEYRVSIKYTMSHENRIPRN